MKHWVDTEFIEDGQTIDLISIGIVAEDGREYYALNLDCDLSKASDWVAENVISKLPLPKQVNFEDWSASPRIKRESRLWKEKALIRAEVAEFLGADCFMHPINPVGWNKFLYDFYAECPEWLEKILKKIPGLEPRTFFEGVYKLNPNKSKPEIWADYADYDWVAFCQLFGTMMDLPKGFPMYCLDIQQWAFMLGVSQLPEQEGPEHHALWDARQVKARWEYLKKWEDNPRQMAEGLGGC
jgi:hypothetical protein